MEALFVGWDRDSDGFITANDLQRGLHSLFGTVPSMLACEMLMAILGRTHPTHFSRSDLKHFIESSPKIPRLALNEHSTRSKESFIADEASSSMANESASCRIDSSFHPAASEGISTRLADADPETPDDSDGKDYRCFNTHELNDLSIDDVSRVFVEDFELVPREMPLPAMTDATTSYESIESKIQAILEQTGDEVPLNYGEKPLIVPDLEELASLNLNGCATSVFVLCDNTVNLLNFKARTLDSGECSNHRFIIHNGLKKKLASLHISIVYSGSLKLGKYFPGELDASLSFQALEISFLPSEKMVYDENSTGSMEIIGEIQQIPPVDENEKFGQIIISFDPQPFIQSGEFELSVRASAITRYSVNITGKACFSAEDVLHHELRRFFLVKEMIGQQRECSLHSWLDLRITERKFFSLDDLIFVAEEERKRSEIDLDQNENLYLSTDCDEQYHVLRVRNLFPLSFLFLFRPFF